MVLTVDIFLLFGNDYFYCDTREFFKESKLPILLLMLMELK